MDQLVAWLWRRSRERFITIAAVAVAVTSAVGYLPYVAFIVGSFYGSKAAVVATVGVATANVATLVVIILWPSPELAHLRRWMAGDRSDPRGALTASFGFVDRAIRRSVFVQMPVYLLALAPFVWAAGDLSVTEAAAYFAFHVAGLVTAPALLGASGDTLLRPIRAEIADLLDGEPVGVKRRTTVARRLSMLGFSFAATVAIADAALMMHFDTAGARFGAGVLGAVGFSALLGWTMWRPVALDLTVHPIADLTAAARRIGTGDYTQSLPVTSDDDLGELVDAVNEMQRGLAQRERLQAAFGSYVDPALAARLLEEGDDTFRGERREVTVMFVDIRDFTPYAEANPAEVVVAHLNAVFTLVVEVVGEHGGHVNKFLGDGAMAVFGAPADLPDHGSRAVAAAREIATRVEREFGDTLRLGIGINSGTVIAGTIGGAGKLEYTLIGDAVNVAARVEQLTKTTHDTTLITDATLAALDGHAGAVTSRGSFELKGKSEPVVVHAL